MATQTQRDIATIKIAIKQLGIRDDDGNADVGVPSTYRQMLLSVTGKTSVSAGAMTDAERARVLAHLRRLGFKAFTKAKPRRASAPKAPGMASRGQIGMIHVLWRALGDNGALDATGIDALRAYVQHHTTRYNSGAGYSAPELLPAKAAGDVIEQLKKWCSRLRIAW